VQVIVTDAPLLHSIIYDAKKRDSFKNLVLEEHNSFNNLNFLLRRVYDYSPNGRIQDKEGSDVIHNEIRKMLDDNYIPHTEIDAIQEQMERIFNEIKFNIELVQANE
jgi:hypothetical protein